MAKKTYSREFKLKVVQTVEAGELRPAQACREYQIAESVLTRWRQEVRLHGCVPSGKPAPAPAGTRLVLVNLLLALALTTLAPCQPEIGE